MKRVELYGRVRHAVMIEGLSQRGCMEESRAAGKIVVLTDAPQS